MKGGVAEIDTQEISSSLTRNLCWANTCAVVLPPVLLKVSFSSGFSICANDLDSA